MKLAQSSSKIPPLFFTRNVTLCYLESSKSQTDRLKLIETSFVRAVFKLKALNFLRSALFSNL